MQLDVINKAKKNIVFGLGSKMVLLLCPFITRTAIQYLLNSEYLGLTSLFNSILLVLSLAELGFSSAVVYNMYKPVANGDVERVNALLLYLRKAYRIIGCIITAVGLMIIPVLPRIIAGTYPEDINITVLYVLFLFDTVISYLTFGYLSSLIVVYQRDDVNSTINTVIMLISTALQVVALKLTHNFYSFAIISAMFGVVYNIWLAIRVHQLFPQYSCRGSLDEKTKFEMRKLVTGGFIHKLCTVLRFSIDSIFISAFLGLTATAIYSNYYAIFNGITQVLFVIPDAFSGGVGNHVASRSLDENYNELKKIDFAYLWVSGWCAICMLCLYQPFMKLWMGKSMMLAGSSVALLCLTFYVCRLVDMRFMYYSANGLWWENRWRAIVETSLNIILNIILGRNYGINGIIIATLISMIACNYIWSNRIVFKQYFGLDKLGDFYRYQLKESGVIVFCGIICACICSWIPISNLVIKLLVRLIICVLVPNIIFFVVYRKSDELEYLVSKIRKGK